MMVKERKTEKKLKISRLVSKMFFLNYLAWIISYGENPEEPQNGKPEKAEGIAFVKQE